MTMTSRSFSSPPPQLQYQQGGASKAWANQKLPSFESLLLAPCWSLRLWSAFSEHSSLIHLECSKQSLAICEMNSRSGQTKTFASQRCSNKLLQICRNISRCNLLSTASHAMLCMYISFYMSTLLNLCEDHESVSLHTGYIVMIHVIPSSLRLLNKPGPAPV